jgi:hypothetical protein
MELTKVVELIQSQQASLESYITIEKSYIPLQLKRQIVKNIVDFSLYTDEETQLLKHDLMLQDLMTILHLVIECTDVQIDDLFTEEKKLNTEVAVEAYDKLIQFGIYKYIEDRLENNDINVLVDYEIQQQLSVVNSVSHIVLKSFEKLFSIIPSQDKIQDLINTLPQTVSQLNGLQFLGGVNQPTTTNPSGVVNIAEVNPSVSESYLVIDEENTAMFLEAKGKRKSKKK